MYEVFTEGKAQNVTGSLIAKVTRNPLQAEENRQARALILEENNSVTSENDLNGYRCLLTTLPLENLPISGLKIPIIHSIQSLEHLKEDDVIICDGRTSSCRTVYRRGSRFNVIFTTEACNSLCLMCSQPPKAIDPNLRLALILEQIKLFDSDTEVMCITGGEPTLMGSNLLKIISDCRDLHPQMVLHMLTNGRNFRDYSFASQYAAIKHPNITAAIPLYSDVDYLHDYVVQSKGAFFQTLNGIHNLGNLGQQIEVRVVIHKQTYKRLPQLAEFIYRNMPFVKHVALMGLEITGYTKYNLESLWIDPFEYQEELEKAVFYLAQFGIHVSIYNHQLCVLRKSLWPFARVSISDWKNVYDDECQKCDVRVKCGGFFKWSPAIRSSHIKAINL